MRRRMWVAALGLVMMGIAVPAGAAGDSPLLHYSKVLSVRCVEAPMNTVRAKVAVRMVVVNGTSWNDHARYMRAKARLVRTTAGLLWRHPWGVEKQLGVLIWGRKYRWEPTLTTDNVAATGEWRVVVKLRWDRPGARDVVHTVKRPFDTSCASVYDGDINYGPGYS